MELFERFAKQNSSLGLINCARVHLRPM